ncbi:glycosyltransferase family 2 protein [Sedimentitalea todarodis]|uniref:Glycosyltransferase family 2 protein n=1 Tax=Sedimentitalea todarodis TaxID=1631240 RepID=A0ABU3VN78_9RHOB|nr:glycosyltransferase family 2 protein [Sedimentitalea todarodis]MDU9007139.1 glycosyltransferase family 2 protein [Sedimentitalea todarodis]
MSEVKWAVITTCAEPKRLVEAFIAHHLAIGAHEIVLFFDDPADGLAETFSQIPRVTCISCDAAYWTKRRPRKGRPSGHRQRQTHNAEYAARNLCESEWIAHIDVDEFLLARSVRSISEMLGRVPETLDAVRVLPAERMFAGSWLPGKMDLSGIFKLKPEWASDWGKELYGADLGELFPNGFQGHEVGKSFKRRRNREARLNIHFVRKDGENIPEHKVEQDEAVLLHMFPVSFEDWVGKYERRIDDPVYFNSMPDHAQKRYSIYRKARERSSEGTVRELFEALSVLPADSPARASRPGLFLRANLDVANNVQRLVRPYLSSAKFEHTSSPAPSPIPDNQRVFQIGMNRCGSKDISAMFGRRGMSYAHWDRGRIARNLRAAQAAEGKPFAGYENYQLLSDISYGSNGTDIYDGFYDFDYIAKFYRDSIFLLNHRPVDEWLSSRRKFRDGKYIAEHMAAAGICSEEAMLAKWAEDWQAHAENVRDSAARGDIRLIEYSLNTEKPFSLFARLEKMLRDRS